MGALGKVYPLAVIFWKGREPQLDAALGQARNVGCELHSIHIFTSTERTNIEFCEDSLGECQSRRRRH